MLKLLEHRGRYVTRIINMFKPDTIAKLKSLNEFEFVWLVEASYTHFAQKYYKYLAEARQLEGLHVPDTIPSPYPHAAPNNMNKDEERATALKNAQQAIKMCNVLDAVLKDLRAAQLEHSAKDIVDFLRSK